jgi:hypothetical protein
MRPPAVDADWPSFRVPVFPDQQHRIESTTTRLAGGLDFTAKGGKRQGREVPQSLKTTR